MVTIAFLALEEDIFTSYTNHKYRQRLLAVFETPIQSFQKEMRLSSVTTVKKGATIMSHPKATNHSIFYLVDLQISESIESEPEIHQKRGKSFRFKVNLSREFKL